MNVYCMDLEHQFQIHVTVVIHGGCDPANSNVYKKKNARNRDKDNKSHFDVILLPELPDAKLITCITFPDMPGEGPMQANIWQRTGLGSAGSSVSSVWLTDWTTGVPSRAETKGVFL
jgi:hypothetical protein